MSEEATPPVDRILAAAEVILRRYGVEKTNVVDIARELGISHTNIYRHFPSKKALLDAVAARWLHVIISPLEIIAKDPTRPATDRLISWFDTLRIAKQRKVLDDPELFRVYHRLAVAAGELANRHVMELVNQVEGIIAEGISRGEFSKQLDARVAALACLQATAVFHHPAMLLQGKTPPREEEAHAVLGFLLAGLRAGPAPLTTTNVTLDPYKSDVSLSR
jgi:AcrR family transcriptional regulator